MFRIHSFVAASAIWLAATTTVLAQANPLEVIPDDALGFAVIRDLSDANDKVTKLTQKMQLPVPDVLSMVKSFAGVDQGLDEKGGLAIALLGGPEGEEVAGMTLIFVVPVTDYDRFVAPLAPEEGDGDLSKVSAFGYPMLVAKKGSFAVFSTEAGQEGLQRFLAANTSVVAAVEPLKAWLAEQQLAIVATPKGKSLLFKSIAESIPDAEQLEEDAQQETPPGALAGVGQMFGIFKELLVSADQQLTHLAAGLRIEDNATLHVALRALFVPDGSLAAWSKQVKVPEAGLLAGVPTGPYVFAYGGVSAQFSPEVWSVISRLSDNGMQIMGLDEEARQKYTELTRKLQVGKRFSGGVMSTLRPGDSLFSTSLSVEHVDNADEHIKLTREALQLMESGLKNPDTEEPMYTIKDVKVGDLDAIEMVTDLGALTEAEGGNNPGAAQMQGIFSQMFGGDGKMTMYVAKATDHAVVSAYSKEQLVRGVEHVRSGAKGLDDDADIAKTTALLPAGSQWAAYVNPQGLMQMVGSFMENMLGGNQFQMPPFPATEPIGLAARVSETGLDAELVVPDNVVAGLGQFIFAFGQMMQGGQVPLP